MKKSLAVFVLVFFGATGALVAAFRPGAIRHNDRFGRPDEMMGGLLNRTIGFNLTVIEWLMILFSASIVAGAAAIKSNP